MKRTIRIVFIILVVFTGLICTSLAISQYRRNQVQLSVVNSKIYEQQAIPELFKLENTDTIHIMIYDKESNDCVYLDEVLLKEISYEHQGIEFENIYKIAYEDIYRAYTNQKIKNIYQVEAIPAIVKIKKTTSGFEKVDAYEWVGSPSEDKANLIDYLTRNGLLN